MRDEKVRTSDYFISGFDPGIKVGADKVKLFCESKGGLAPD
jgi:hypothetical protein